MHVVNICKCTINHLVAETDTVQICLCTSELYIPLLTVFKPNEHYPIRINDYHTQFYILWFHHCLLHEHQFSLILLLCKSLKLNVQESKILRDYNFIDISK